MGEVCPEGEYAGVVSAARLSVNRNAAPFSGRPGPVPLFALLTFFLVILTLAVAGAATPFPLVADVLSFHGRIQTMLVTAAAMTPLVFPLFITPHRWRGEPPLLADRLPIFWGSLTRS